MSTAPGCLTCPATTPAQPSRSFGAPLNPRGQLAAKAVITEAARAS